MRSIDLGPAPADEIPITLSNPRYIDDSAHQCAVYMAQIRRACGSESVGARLTIHTTRDRLGRIAGRSVVLRVAPAGEAYAMRVQAFLPRVWDSQSNRELLRAKRRVALSPGH